MEILEKILEEIKRIKDGNRKEKLYAKYPPNSKDQEVLNAYSQGYEDGTDNFYNAVEEIIRKHMNDGWIPVEERLPEVDEDTEETIEDDDCPEYIVTIRGASESTTLKYSPDGTWFDENGYVYNVIAWRPMPEAYRPADKTERSEGE